MSVKRYDAYYKDDLGYYGQAALREEPDGDLVKFDDYDALQRELAEAQERHGRYVKAVGELAGMAAELAEAREALWRYGAHHGDCSYDPSTWNDGPTPCDCGFDAFLAATAKEGER